MVGKKAPHQGKEGGGKKVGVLEYDRTFDVEKEKRSGYIHHLFQTGDERPSSKGLIIESKRAGSRLRIIMTVAKGKNI